MNTAHKSFIVFHCMIPWVVVSTAAYHAGFRGLFPSLGGLKETKMFLPHPLVKLRCSVLGLRPPGSEFQILCQEVLLARFSLCVHKSGLKPH